MNPPSTFRWYFVHLLAVLTLFELGLLVWIYQSAAGKGFMEFELSPLVGVLSGLGVFATIWFCLQMAVDLFRHRDSMRAGWWALLLLTAQAGALIYFWFAWRDRRPSRSGN